MGGMRRLTASTVGSLAVVTVVLAARGHHLGGPARTRHPTSWTSLLPLIATAGMLLRERYPVLALVVVSAAVVAYYPFARLDAPLIFLPFVVLYTAADRGRLIAAIATGAASLLAMGLGELQGTRHVDDSTFVMIAGWVVAAIAAGGVTHNRRAFLREAEQRVRDAEHSKEEEARRRAGEERLRIARELHDVLGHNISMINVQASAALHGLKKRPEEAESALRTIKDTSKETLRELRTTLGVLRQVDEDAPTAPAGSLARLDALVEASGLERAHRGVGAVGRGARRGGSGRGPDHPGGADERVPALRQPRKPP